MGESFLWLVNHSGDAFSLGTGQRLFGQLANTFNDTVTVKRLAASKWCAWAVGHDHRPYLYVFSSDVPIRIPETTYENQRWSPFHGFSKKSMIISDRHAWSDESGIIERPKESVRLPSAHWEWDGDWMIDDNLRGEVVELGGWQYAVDFPALYTPEQHWNSFVRRRKWIHFRRFSATGNWANISDMEMVEKSECFIDISVGGFLLPSQPEGFLSVWAVMNSGSVYVRTKVHRDNPEGSSWQSISLEEHHGIINISVGATNLVWAVTWDGQGLVRTNVSRNNVYGSSWLEVESPEKSSRLMQVAIGRNAVWAVTRDHKVWFRKGTWGDHAFWIQESAMGSHWVEMVGEMSQIALSSNDQVFAIDVSGHCVYFRTAVSSHDLTGKTWQKVTLHEDLSQFRELGLLADGRVCSCAPSFESFCEIHDTGRAPSESTSCSSVSLSTTTSSSANINDDFAGSADVFMTPLVPSKPGDFSRMMSIEDHYPPVWSLGGEESKEPDTPTMTQAHIQPSESSQPAFFENGLSRSPSLPLVVDDQTSEAGLLDNRVRSVSQYSLTDSLSHSEHSLSDSLHQSPRTGSPASSTSTLQVAFTKSVSSQTDGNSGEFTSSQRTVFQTSAQLEVSREANLTDQAPLFKADEDDLNLRVNSVENIARATDVPEDSLNTLNSTGFDLDGNAEGESSVIFDTQVRSLSRSESNTDLTEVDRHFKFEAGLISHVYEQSSDKVENSAAKISHLGNSQPLDSNVNPSVSGREDSNGESIDIISHPARGRDYSSIVYQSGAVLTSTMVFQSERGSEMVRVEDNDTQYLSLPESGKSRSNKSRRRSNSDRKLDLSDDCDSIVFKPARRKKDRNRRKDSGASHSQAVIESSIIVSVLDTSQTSQISKQAEEKKSTEKEIKSQEVDILSKPKEDFSQTDRTQQESKDVTDSRNALGPVVEMSSVLVKESDERIPDALDHIDELNFNEVVPTSSKSSSDFEATTSVKVEKTFHNSTEECIKNISENISSEDIAQVKDSQNDPKPELNQKHSDCDKIDKNKFDITVKTNSDINSMEPKELGDNMVVDHFAKVTKHSKVSVSCQTKASPRLGMRNAHLKDGTSNWCAMTKLVPSMKKPKVKMTRSFSSMDEKAKVSGSDSDEIADFVTDLLSEEDSEAEDHHQQQMEAVEGENSEKTKEEEVPKNSTNLPFSGNAEQLHKAASVASAGSASSCMEGRWPLSRRVPGGSFRNSPPVPTSLQLKQAGLCRQTPSPGRLSTPSLPDFDPTLDNVPGQTVLVAQPRLCWRWLDATSCVIDDPSKVEWLSRVEDAGHERKIKISKKLREKILQQIVERNKREVVGFISFDTAVEKSTWVRKASMHMYQYGRHSRWTACRVELEQGLRASDTGTLTIHYTNHKKQRHTQIQLSDMICVKMSTDPDLTTAFTVFTPDLNLTHQPIMLKASSEKEATEWLGYLSYAKASSWNLDRPIPPGAVWSCSFTGDVLVSPSQQDYGKPYLRCWGQHGGHMAMIETSPCGVTWGLGFDKMAHVYNGGYGGSVCTGQSDMSDNTQQMIDTHRVYVYENQKWFPLVGWCNKGVFYNNFHWVTSSGQFVTSRDEVKLPSSKWNWISDWTIDFSTNGGVDSDGWQYSKQFNGSFHRGSYLRDQYRRRRWVRRCRISMMGPWISAGSLTINDLSIQIDTVESPSDPVIMWAVATNGDVLTRYGVTQNNPLGDSWVHVSRDQDKPFLSISVGGRGQVWGVAGDGSAWYRTGVSPENPAGKYWIQVVPPPPGGFRLRHVSVGSLAVWAVDTGDNLWRRENITPTFPEGTGWESVANKVKRVSVGPLDQVWIVADAFFQKSRLAPGVIYHRQGISEKYPGGTGWQRVIGSGWAHVSVRGMTTHLGNADSGIEES